MFELDNSDLLEAMDNRVSDAIKGEELGSIVDYIERVRRRRQLFAIAARRDKLMKRVKFFPPLKYIHGKTIDQLTAQLVLMRLER